MTHARHHAQLHAQTRTRERRHRVAHEAARLMAEGGIRDFQQAKLKAAQRLGITDDASLPRNREIEDALREYQRLFLGDARLHTLREQRLAALQGMEFFAAFEPRLVGPVLDGTADANTPITLHLHHDDPRAVPQFLQQHGIPAQSRQHRLRMDRQRDADVDVWAFRAEAHAFDVTALPLDALRQAPLSGVDGKPMQRASLTQLRALLIQD